MHFNNVLQLKRCDFATAPDAVVDTTLLFEEFKRIYSRTNKPVEVDFRQIVSWLKVGDQLTHHFHPYPAKLLPHIAHFFLRSKLSESSYVLDPFCGSGTVALEASIAGATPLVSDANPFAILLTKAKTTPYDVSRLRAATQKIVAKAARLRTAHTIPIVNERKWYADSVKRRLEILLRAIRENSDPDLEDFFLVCFSVVARKVSRIDLGISVPVQLRLKSVFTEAQNAKIAQRLAWVENARPADEFYSVCHANIARVEAANKVRPNRMPAVIVGTDARCLGAPSLPESGVPLIITSPPYGTAQKYVRASSLSLNWLGMIEPEKLSELEGKSIGREHSPAYRKEEWPVDLPPAFQRLIQDIAKINSLRAQITAQYLTELKAALREMCRNTSVGGHIVLVIGNNQVCGMTLATNDYISAVMLDFGCIEELVMVDNIKSRGLLTKRNTTASVISREFIMVFRKRD